MLINSLSNRMIRNPLARVVVVLGSVLGLAACDDTLGLRATFSVEYDTLSAYAMTQTPISFPAAYSAGNGLVVRVDPEIAFDIAFDLPGTGKVQLIPARRQIYFRAVRDPNCGFRSLLPGVPKE
jgi:hypothetical protein